MTKRVEDITLLELRKRVGLSQQDVAFLVGVRTATISNWERRLAEPRLKPSQVRKLMRALKCTLTELIVALEGQEALKRR